MASTKISDHVYKLCTTPQSVSSLLAQDPKLSPGEAAKRLYHPEGIRISEPGLPKSRTPASAEELQRAYKCGKWGPTKPSELFLRIFHDSLLPLNHDPLMGCCSPSMVGSCGAVPLTVLAPLEDICRHMSNLIARADKEVFLATNYWAASDSATLITDAMKELSRRCGKRNTRAVIKVLYDRGNLKQFMDNHQVVPEKEYTGDAVKLPSKEEIPNCDLEVVNFHRPLLGTFHSKLMVVDRKFGVLGSNNIQENSNVEMMVALEGPIVDSLYDTLMVSWHRELNPPMPCHATPAAEGGLPTFDDPNYRGIFDQNGNLNLPEMGEARSLEQVAEDGKQEHLPMHKAGDNHWDDTVASEVRRMQAALTPKSGETMLKSVNRHLNETSKSNAPPTAPEFEEGDEFTPYIPLPVHELVPMAMVNRKPYGATNKDGVFMPQNECWMSAIRNAKSDVFIQTPDLNAEALLPELIAACRRGIQVTYSCCLGYNDTGELLPGQGGHNEMVANKLYEELGDAENRSRLHVQYYVAKDQNVPLHARTKQRTCHIKLMIVDSHICVQGNGNMDTQSWYHSQEINVLIDSPMVAKRWREGIERCQNTTKYGQASQEDGLYRMADGSLPPMSIGKDPGQFAWAKGFYGAVQRVRGKGGF